MNRTKKKWTKTAMEFLLPFLSLGRINFFIFSLNFASASLMRSFPESFLYPPMMSASSAWSKNNTFISMIPITRGRNFSFLSCESHTVVLVRIIRPGVSVSPSCKDFWILLAKNVEGSREYFTVKRTTEAHELIRTTLLQDATKLYFKKLP